MAILLLSWQSFFTLDETPEYQVVELYAGVGRIAKLSNSFGYTAGVFDVSYDAPEFTDSWPGSPRTKQRIRTCQSGKKASMDLTTSAGFAFLGLQG